MSLLKIENLSVSYGQKKILSDIDLTLENGKIYGLLGQNGSGKTTLLKAIGGIIPHRGDCFFNGKNRTSYSSKQLAELIGYIPQKTSLSIDLAVSDVILMGYHHRLGLLDYPTSQMRSHALDVIETVGLGGLENQNFMTLSEGQKQLCILARTLVTSHDLLLLDEPESALDLQMSHQVIHLLSDSLHADPEIPVQKQGSILITLHDVSLALNCCDEIFLLKDGKICVQIAPQNDSIDYMERCLSAIYGPVCLMQVRTRNGKEQFVMLKEETRS